LHVHNGERFQGDRVAQVQPESSDGGVERLDGMQGLHVHRGLKIPKKLCNTPERRPGLKRAKEERRFLAHNLHVSKLLLVCIDQLH